MAFTNKSYFRGEINIPNDNKQVVAETIQLFINTEEPRFLRELLGDKLTRMLIDDQGMNEPFKSLVNGADFTMEYGDRTLDLHWKGFVNTELISPIAYFIYCQYRIATNSVYNGQNELKGKSENARDITSRAKVVNAWNRMVELRGSVPDCFNSFIEADYVVYNPNASAYNYLLANQDQFPDWIFTPQNEMNVFGF